MDVKPENVGVLRAYVYDYVIGLLWLLGLAALVINRDRALQLAELFNVVAKSMPDVKIPDIVTGFLFAIAGVLLPYCVCTVLKALSLRVMSLVLALQRNIDRKWFQPAVKNSAPDVYSTLRNAACARIRGALHLPNVGISRDLKVVYIRQRNPLLSPFIEQMRDDLFFRAAAAMPSAFLFGALTYRISSAVAGMIVAIPVFAISAWFTNKEYDEWFLTVHAAIVIEPSDTVAAVNANQPSQTLQK